MSLTITGFPITKFTDLTDNSETTIFETPQQGATVLSIGWSETSGGTHTLLIVMDDGSADHVLRGAKALTAYEIGQIDEVIRLKSGQSLKATSSDGTGKVDLRVTYLAPDAGVAGNRR
jgi:hypothetical protein